MKQKFSSIDVRETWNRAEAQMLGNSLHEILLSRSDDAFHRQGSISSTLFTMDTLLVRGRRAAACNKRRHKFFAHR
jgi:hypothetical protein